MTLCFEVAVNGERWCRAGIGQGVMDAFVTWVGVEPTDLAQTTLSVSGTDSAERAVHWRDITRRLLVGDVVEVRIVDAEPDPPVLTPVLPEIPGEYLDE